MAIDVIMPKAGMDMQEGQIFKWHKKVGDYVQKGELLLEIVTDKVNMEVEAEESGYLLKILKEEGETVPVITTIAYLGEQDEKIETLVSLHENDDSSVAFGVRATPKARKYAKEKGIELSQVHGTQEKGRICYDDVTAYDASKVRVSGVAKTYANYEGMEIPQGISGSGIGGKVMKSDLLQWKRDYSKDVIEESKESETSEKSAVERLTRIQKMNNMRAVIAKRMKQSYLESPVVHYNMRANMSRVQDFIKTNKKLLKETYDLKIGVNDFIMLALSRTLMEHPHLNCRMEEENNEIIYHEYVDLAMAVGLEEGLLTPVIRNAQKMSLVQIALSSREMSKKARDGKLSMEELSYSTFTVSNLGMYGIESFTPIINQPNTAILGVG